MIVTSNLTKKFGNFKAVNALNLRINPGESYGFLGPNGAGKTTTILMLLGILTPTSGKVLINGERIRSDSFALKRKIGVVAEYQTFYETMTAWEYIQFFADLYQVEAPEDRAEALFDKLQLTEWKNTLIHTYSTGMKKKLGFIRALIHSPNLLILDEPVSGLDPFGIIQVRELLMAEKECGSTLVISSHILSEVEQTADRVGIISKGKLILEDTMENIRCKVGEGDRINLVFAELTNDNYERLAGLPFVISATREGSQVALVTQNDKDYRAEIGQFVLAHQLVILELRRSESSLEEVYVKISENKLQIIKDDLSSGDGHG